MLVSVRAYVCTYCTCNFVLCCVRLCYLFLTARTTRNPSWQTTTVAWRSSRNGTTRGGRFSCTARPGTEGAESKRLVLLISVATLVQLVPPAFRRAVRARLVVAFPNLFRSALSTGFSCCLLYTSPSPRDKRQSRMPSSA